ncbi:hypothetical protein NEICINOT_03174 [Neisseria cinerea ATCC 14685]|uniref:Uncharacterized protein n=1 Tax=Neisseria cinerea ATCC 14685 TaxID=546262 RepID=D0W0K9_NEICI|nr:hypothetical protein NEICINOT_03174 [Neisseria cinerea ATCC 14685]
MMKRLWLTVMVMFTFTHVLVSQQTASTSLGQKSKNTLPTKCRLNGFQTAYGQ